MKVTYKCKQCYNRCKVIMKPLARKPERCLYSGTDPVNPIWVLKPNLPKGEK